MADKRVYELPSGSIDLDAYFIFDKLGYTEAKRSTIQDLIDLVSNNVSNQILTSGTSNPDNANGSDGDFYIKTDGTTILSFWQKSLSVWSLKASFTHSGGGSAALTFTVSGGAVDTIDMSGFSGMPALGTFPSALRVYADNIDLSQSASFTPNTQILFGGFNGSETEITIKITF